jgi:hypothetical protein
MKKKIVKSKSLPSRIKKVKEIILSAGNTIGAVTFKKRTNGAMRKMSYRLHVRKPTHAPMPKGDNYQKRREIDRDNLQLTVFDVNKVKRDKGGSIIGRGAYVTIPLENVERICARGVEYIINT